MRKKLGMYLFGLIVSPIVVLGALIILARPIHNHPFFDHNGVLVIAHRGGLGLWPENTPYAFEHAVELGVDVLEMDVQSTEDGELVVMHDGTVDRTTNGTGRVQELTLAELRQLDAGYTWTADNGRSFPFRGLGLKVPTLTEVFATFPSTAMNMEIKQSEPSIVAPLCRMIRDYGMFERVLVASADTSTLKELRRLYPEVATSAGENEVRLFYGLILSRLGRVYRPHAEALQVPEYSGNRKVVSRQFVEAAHERGMKLHIWTVNNVEDMQRMLDLGVDGIITDYPDQLLSLLRR